MLILARAVSIAAAGTISGATAAEQAIEVRLGAIFPVSKTSSTFGESLKRGMLLALSTQLGEPRQIAEDHLLYNSPAVIGVNIHLYLRDDQAQPVLAEALAQGLLKNEEVHLIIGSGNSNCTARVRDVGVTGGLPILTPMSSATRLTTKSTAGLFFRLQAPDQAKMAVVARLIVERDHVTRLAVFYEDDPWYGEGLRDDLIASLEQMRFTHYRLFKFSRNDARRSLKTDEKDIAEFKPDGAALLGLDPDVVAIGQVLNNLHLDIPAYFTGDNEDYLAKIPLSRAYALAMVYYRNSPAAIAEDYQEAFKRRYGELPGSSSAHGYDAGTLVAAIVRQLAGNGSQSPFLKSSLKDQRLLVAQQLAKAHFNGLLGPTSFDEFGNPDYQLNVVPMAELRRDNQWKLAWGELLRTIDDHLLAESIVGAWLLLLVGTYMLVLRKPTLLPSVGQALERIDRAVEIKEFQLFAIFRALLLPDAVIYQSRILDHWLKAVILSHGVIEKFANRPVIRERGNYVQVPIKVDGAHISRPDRRFFAVLIGVRRRYCLEIAAEGGAGKTSLACRLANWGLGAAIQGEDEREGFPPFLPIFLDFDVVLDAAEAKDKQRRLLALLSERLCSLLDFDGEVPEGLIKRLLRSRRAVVIADRLSEVSEGLQSLLFDSSNSSLINGLIITSRKPMAERLGRACIVAEPLRIDQERLLPFIIEYLRGHDSAQCLTDKDYQRVPETIRTFVGSRKVTALFVTMYADVLALEAAQGSVGCAVVPTNLPELILTYIQRTNAGIEGGMPPAIVVRAGKALAWACLERAHRPGEIEESTALKVLQGEDGHAVLKYLVERIHLLQALGPTADRYRFSLEPVAEYLAAMQRFDTLRDSTKRWHELVRRSAQLCARDNSCISFVRAVGDVLAAARHVAPAGVLESIDTLLAARGVRAEGGNDDASGPA